MILGSKQKDVAKREESTPGSPRKKKSAKPRGDQAKMRKPELKAEWRETRELNNNVHFVGLKGWGQSSSC